MSSSLQLHRLQHTRVPCPSPSPGVCSNSCPLSLWCHLTTSSSSTSFFCLQSFPVTGSFSISWLFASGGQSIGATASASVLPMNIQGWFPLGLTGLIYLQSKSLLQDHNLKASILWCSAFFMVQVSHPCMTAGKTIALTYCLGLNLSELALTPHLPLKNIWKFLPPCLCLTFPLWVNSHIYYM